MQKRNVDVERREREEKKVEKAGLDPAAAAPSQPDRLDGSHSDHSAEWCERLLSRQLDWLGAAAAGSSPASAFSTFFSSLK